MQTSAGSETNDLQTAKQTQLPIMVALTILLMPVCTHTNAVLELFGVSCRLFVSFYKDHGKPALQQKASLCNLELYSMPPTGVQLLTTAPLCKVNISRLLEKSISL